jgi:hypothetical protein
MRYIFFFLFVTVFSFSCRQKLPQDESVKYLESLLKVGEIDAKENTLLNTLDKARAAAKENIPDTEYKKIVDSLQFIYKEVTAVYNSKLLAADSIKELDEDIGLKRVVTEFVEKRKKLHSLFSILINGMAPNRFNKTPEQEDQFKEFKDFAKKIDEENPGGIIGEKFKDFMQKHNIKDFDIGSNNFK